MATAISIDQTDPPDSCQCPHAPDLTVRFVSVKQQPQQQSNNDDNDPNNANTSQTKPKTNTIAASARQQEIFLDYVGLLSSSSKVQYDRSC